MFLRSTTSRYIFILSQIIIYDAFLSFYLYCLSLITYHLLLIIFKLLFNRKALLAEAVKGITLEEVMVMFNEKILNLNTRMKIAGYVYGKDFKFEDLNAHVESSNTLSASEPVEEREEFFEVEDPAYFKSLMSLAPFSGSNDVLFKAALDN